jgi:hypothetical protein
MIKRQLKAEKSQSSAWTAGAVTSQTTARQNAATTISSTVGVEVFELLEAKRLKLSW